MSDTTHAHPLETLEDAFRLIDQKDAELARPRQALNAKKTEFALAKDQYEEDAALLEEEEDADIAYQKAQHASKANKLILTLFCLFCAAFVALFILILTKYIPAIAADILKGEQTAGFVVHLIITLFMYLPLALVAFFATNSALLWLDLDFILDHPAILYSICGALGVIFPCAVAFYPISEPLPGQAIVGLLPVVIFVILFIIGFVSNLSHKHAKCSSPATAKLDALDEAFEAQAKVYEKEIALLEKEADKADALPRTPFQFSGHKISANPGNVLHELELLSRAVARMEANSRERKLITQVLDGFGWNVLPEHYRSQAIMEQIVEVAKSSRFASMQAVYVRYEQLHADRLNSALQKAEKDLVYWKQAAQNSAKDNAFELDMFCNKLIYEERSLKSQHEALLIQRQMLQDDLEHAIYARRYLT
jgi:hypothetical protein